MDLMHKADNHTCGLLTEGQQPKFASSIRLLKTEGHIGPRKEDLRQDVVYVQICKGALSVSNVLFFQAIIN